MKYVYYYISLLVLLCSATCRAQEYDALLMVHFGTTYDATRQKTIDAINEKVCKSFPQYVFAEAYTSRIVMKRLAERGIKKLSPLEAMFKLRSEGYRKLIIQPSFIIDGKEMDMLRHDVERMRPFFDEIRIGTPLLYTVKDAEHVCDILVKRHLADARKREHVVFVGHGTEGPATAIYSQLDYMLEAQGHANYHVATIEGYPTYETVLAKLKAQKGKKVTLVPLLFVAGDHVSNDISVEWKERLEKEDFSVSLAIEGLGEVPEIQDLYIEKVKH